jgi:DNA-directed RNA polymerase specialized sigma24 family protein
MGEMPSSKSLQIGMRAATIRLRIASFSKRFGPGHLNLAYHAAFPLALTPDLLYRLWANFPRDIHGESLKIPWVAVADLLLSGLCEEVSQELYEMNAAIRNELLRELKVSPNLGELRVHELSGFLLTYVHNQLNSPDPDTRTFARSQHWTALAYTKPSEAARKLAEALSELDWDDRAEQIRMASVIETFVEQLDGFYPLLIYAKGIAHFARNEMKGAEVEFNKATEGKEFLEIQGVKLHVPKPILERINEAQSRIRSSLKDHGTQSTSVSSDDISISGFTVHDLRYNLEVSYPKLTAYLQLRAKRYLGSFAYDTYEVDLVVGHVIEQLTRLQLFGGGDLSPETALDRMSNTQFYAFLNRSVKNKAIDRLRQHHLPSSSITEIGDIDTEAYANESAEEKNNLLDSVIESIWSTSPFPTPEVAVLQTTSQEELHILIKHCIEELSSAPRQLLAIIQELDELGIEDLVQQLKDEFRTLLANVEFSNLSRHRDLAHKKLRHCLQHSSTNLAVLVALRLTEYRHYSTGIEEMSVDIKTLVDERISEAEVLKGLNHLARVGLLDWHGEENIRLTSVQLKHLARFYEEGE